MPRTSTNPNKTLELPIRGNVYVLVITHLPNESEYHKNRLAVVRRSLDTLTRNVQRDHNLIIWDNGSDRDMQELVSGYRATVVYSENIGKTNALKSVMRSLPESSILAYGDDDIEYFPNWLQPQIDILTTFPNVGTVTGWPTRLEHRWGQKSTWEFAHNSEGTQLGRFIPDDWERDYCESLGRDWPTHQINTKNDTDLMVQHKGVRALATSHHCQFVCYPERVEPLIPWTNKAMQPEREFDMAVGAAGYMRLATVERLTRHIGNKL